MLNGRFKEVDKWEKEFITLDKKSQMMSILGTWFISLLIFPFCLIREYLTQGHITINFIVFLLIMYLMSNFTITTYLLFKMKNKPNS